LCCSIKDNFYQSGFMTLPPALLRAAHCGS
jgi:hypothetical protein